MIHSLRRNHRAVMTVLAFVLPAVFVSGLLVRRPVPATARLPIYRTSPAAKQNRVIFTTASLWPNASVSARVLRPESQDSVNGLLLELQAARDFAIPDALIYWSGEKPNGDALPERAVLLGKLDGTQAAQVALPNQASATRGHLILYSLAERRVVAVTEFPNGGAL